MSEEKKIERDLKRTRKRASDYLPPEETRRLAVVIDTMKAEVGRVSGELSMVRANLAGTLAVKDMEIEALKKGLDELVKQRDAAWAKPENLVETPANG